MKVKFSDLTEALVQTSPSPLVFGGVQQQKDKPFALPNRSEINVAQPTITAPVGTGIPLSSTQQPAQPPQIPQSALITGSIGKSNSMPSALSLPEPTSLSVPTIPTGMIPSSQQTGAWGGAQPQQPPPITPSTPKPSPAPAPPPTPAPSKPKPKTPKPEDQSGDKYQKVIDRYNRWADVEAAKANYYEQQKRASALRESYKFNRGYLKSLLAEQGGGGGLGGGGGGKVPGANPETETEKAIKYVKSNLKLGPIGSLIGKGVKKGYEVGKGLIRDVVKPLAIEASPLLTPPKEAMASLTGRLSGLGYTERGIKDRMDYYRRLLGAEKQDPNTWKGAWKDEAAKLMTAALYDPRALSKLQ